MVNCKIKLGVCVYKKTESYAIHNYLMYNIIVIILYVTKQRVLNLDLNLHCMIVEYNNHLAKLYLV